MISIFDLGIGEPSLEKGKLKKTLTTHLSELSTITFYPFEHIDKDLINSQMLQYYIMKTYKTYEERVAFFDEYTKKQNSKFKSEPITEVSDISQYVIETYRAYMAQTKNYKATQVNPSLAVMQTECNDDSFSSYPLTEEKIEYGFEKVLFNKKDRYFNGEKRITAMRALLLGPFIHGLPNAIPRVIRYIAAVAQTTTNSTEKQQILSILDPCSLMKNVYFAIIKKIFQLDFIQFAKQAAEAYFRYPDVLQKYAPAIKTQLARNLLEYVFNESPAAELSGHVKNIATALVEMQSTIPDLVYTVSNFDVQPNSKIA